MKNRFILLLLGIIMSLPALSQGVWTWMHGDKAANINRVYGTLGVPASGNTPGSRIGASFWTDRQGNLWLFGGKGNNGLIGNGVFNDLWKYNTSTNQWAWMGGDKNLSPEGVFTEKGDASDQNNPGARQNGVSWVDNNGNFWLFGGLGMPSRSTDEDDDDDDDDDIDLEEPAFLNDLWKYSPTSGQWTFVSGTAGVNQQGEYGDITQGSPSNYPGGRYSASGWKDNNGNLWLFGGRGYSSRNAIGLLDDVWRYSPANNSWTWMSGDERGEADQRYGQKGSFADANTPGGRHGCMSWTDNNGNFWLYGGGTQVDLFGDLWRYDQVNRRWAWISGSNATNQPPKFSKVGVAEEDAHPGARTLSAVWVDASNDVWLFGGNGYGGSTGSNPLNNLWKYSIATNEWTYAKGDISNPSAEYGSKGVPDAGNNPGGTGNLSYWQGEDGEFWMFGGRRTGTDYLNQVWRLSIGCQEELTGTISPVSANICEGGSVELTVSGGSSYEWFFNGEKIEDETESKISVTRAGTYTASIKDGECTGTASNSVVVALADAPTGNISPASASICEGGSTVLTATGGTSYEWKRNGTIIQGQTTETITANQPGTYSVTIINGECRGPAANTSVVSNATAPTGNISPASASICEGGSTVLTATGGTSYEWKRDGTIIQGQTTEKITANQPGTYSVTIINGDCRGPASNTSVITRATSPTGNISPASASICEGGSTVLTATGGTSYEWKRDGTIIQGQTTEKITANQPGTYSVTIINGDCRGPAANTSVITRATAPTGNISPASASICEGGSTVLTATGGTSYEWMLNGVKIQNQTTATLTADQPGTYSVTIINGTCKGPASNTSVVTIGNSPTGTISPATANICEGAFIELTATGGTSYEWQLNGVKIENQTAAILRVNTPGTYTATIINGECIGPASNTSEISISTTSGVRYPDLTTKENVPLRLTARSMGTEWQWNPATGLDDPSSIAPLATLTKDQLYFVDITNEQGCIITDTQFVKVTPSIPDNITSRKVGVPSAFTPNSNNVNDQLRPLGDIGKLEYFKVYNRWGVMVFQTNTIGNGWDGRHKGIMQNPDTYTWILVGEMRDGQPIKLSGKTLLIR